MEETLLIAKKVIIEEVKKAGKEVDEILLFGSRARTDFNKESDWDLFVVLKEDISFKELKKITGKIQLRLAELDIPNDVILRGLNQFTASKRIVGNISYYVAQEGVRIWRR